MSTRLEIIRDELRQTVIRCMDRATPEELRDYLAKFPEVPAARGLYVVEAPDGIAVGVVAGGQPRSDVAVLCEVDVPRMLAKDMERSTAGSLPSLADLFRLMARTASTIDLLRARKVG